MPSIGKETNVAWCWNSENGGGPSGERSARMCFNDDENDPDNRDHWTFDAFPMPEERYQWYDDGEELSPDDYVADDDNLGAGNSLVKTIYYKGKIRWTRTSSAHRWRRNSPQPSKTEEPLF